MRHWLRGLSVLSVLYALETTMIVKLCKCEGNRKGRQLATFKRALLDRGAHTDFILIRCAQCQRLCGFPPQNFKLAALTGTPLLWLTIELVANYARFHSS